MSHKIFYDKCSEKKQEPRQSVVSFNEYGGTWADVNNVLIKVGNIEIANYNLSGVFDTAGLVVKLRDAINATTGHHGFSAIVGSPDTDLNIRHWDSFIDGITPTVTITYDEPYTPLTFTVSAFTILYP